MRRLMVLRASIPPLAALCALAATGAPAAAETDLRFTLNENGLGPIQADAPVDLDAIRAAYPGLEIGERLSNGAVVVYAQAPDGVAFGATYVDGVLREIEIFSTQFAGPNDSRPGQTHGALDWTPPVMCTPAPRGYACAASDAPLIEYVFDGELSAIDEQDRVVAIRLVVE